MSSVPTKTAMSDSALKRLRWRIAVVMSSACEAVGRRSSRPASVVDSAVTQNDPVDNE